MLLRSRTAVIAKFGKMGRNESPGICVKLREAHREELFLREMM
jgi:hypothetical protein